MLSARCSPFMGFAPLDGRDEVFAYPFFGATFGGARSGDTGFGMFQAARYPFPAQRMQTWQSRPTRSHVRPSVRHFGHSYKPGSTSESCRREDHRWQMRPPSAQWPVPSAAEKRYASPAHGEPVETNGGRLRRAARRRLPDSGVARHRVPRKGAGGRDRSWCGMQARCGSPASELSTLELTWRFSGKWCGSSP